MILSIYLNPLAISAYFTLLGFSVTSFSAYCGLYLELITGQSNLNFQSDPHHNQEYNKHHQNKQIFVNLHYSSKRVPSKM
jgi:uncharacterized membrane protein YraQ (UPF0718 family)